MRLELFAQALQRQRPQVGTGFAESLGGNPGSLTEFTDARIERAATQVQPGIQRALDLEVEPALDAARNELKTHRIDQQARNHADHGEDRGQLDQQPATELAPPQADQQAHRGNRDHQGQQAGDGHVDPEQPQVVTLVERGRIGGERQQERKHERRARHRNERYDPGPARRFGHDRCAIASAPQWNACVRSMARVQSAWPPMPICIGRGSWLVSRRKLNSR